MSLHFWESKRQGTAVGRVLAGSGLVLAGHTVLSTLLRHNTRATTPLGMLFVRTSRNAGWLLGGAAALVAVGVWLRTKTYLGDPEAIKEYRQQFFAAPLASSLKRFGWSGIFRVVTLEEMRSRFHAEAQGDRAGLYLTWRELEQTNMEQLLSLGVIDAAYLRGAFLRDFDAPPAAYALSGDAGGIDLLRGLDQYGLWLVARVGEGAAFLQLVHSKVAQHAALDALTFAQLADRNAAALHRAGLLPPGYLHARFQRDAAAGIVSFSVAAQRYGPWLLDDGVVPPEDLAPLYERERGSLDVVLLLSRFWTWPIAKYSTRLLPAADYYKLQGLAAVFQAAKLARTRAKRRANDDYTNDLAAADRTRTRALDDIERRYAADKPGSKAAAATADSTAAAAAAARRLQESKAAEVATARAAYQQEKERLDRRKERALADAAAVFDAAKVELVRAWADHLADTHLRTAGSGSSSSSSSASAINSIANSATVAPIINVHVINTVAPTALASASTATATAAPVDAALERPPPVAPGAEGSLQTPSAPPA